MCRLFAPAIIRCIAEQRAPSDPEFDEVAARLWDESFGCDTGISWRDTSNQCPRHQITRAAARAALLGADIRS